MSMSYNLKSIFSMFFSFFLLAAGKKQLPRSPIGPTMRMVKDRVTAIRAYGGALIKKQEYDQAIPVLLKGLAFFATSVAG